MLYNILWKALTFSIVAFLFRSIEESIPLIKKHGDIGTPVRSLQERS